MRPLYKKLFFGLLLCVVTPAAISAASFSFTGNFSVDDEVLIFDLSLASDSVVLLKTWSFAGGLNQAGELIPSGGFDPILTLFDETGDRITAVDDAFNAPPDPNTGDAFDSEIFELLPAGRYILALTQFDNFSQGDFADGFLRAGEGNFTARFGCPAGSFCDVDGNDRTSFYALDISDVDTATLVPEPATGALLGAGLLAAWRLRRRRR